MRGKLSGNTIRCLWNNRLFGRAWAHQLTVMMRGLHPGGPKHKNSKASSARSKRASRQVVAVSASVEQQVFNQLLNYANVKANNLDVAAIDGNRGNGLVIKQEAAKKGEVCSCCASYSRA
jgi:hypothetical protein